MTGSGKPSASHANTVAAPTSAVALTSDCRTRTVGKTEKQGAEVRTGGAGRASLLDGHQPGVCVPAAGLTVDDDGDLLVVYLSSGGHASLTVVNPLVRLLDAANLEVSVVQHPETH